MNAKCKQWQNPQKNLWTHHDSTTNQYRIGTNAELEELYNHINIVLVDERHVKLA